MQLGLGLVHSFHKATGDRWRGRRLDPDLYWIFFFGGLFLAYLAFCVIACVDSLSGGNFLGLGQGAHHAHAIKIFYHGHGVTVEKLHGHIIVKR